MDVKNLPDIDFVKKSLEDIISENIASYEKLFLEHNGVEKKLYPGDPMRIYIFSKSLREYQLLYLINDLAKQNLLKYARGPLLRHLGAFFNTDIFEAKPAETVMKYIISKTFDISYVIAAGTRFTSGNGVFFASSMDISIQPGEKEALIPVKCEVAGVIGNDYIPGQINKLADALPFVEAVMNVSTSTGGADVESDEDYKERIRLAPGEYSTAGPDSAYKSMAKKYSQTVQDVHVYSSSPGVVDIVVAMTHGQPTAEEIAEIQTFVSDKKRRPFTDNVVVKGPDLKNYGIALSYYISSEKSLVEDETKTAIGKAIDDYKTWQSAKIGRHINPSILIGNMVKAGASRVEVSSPIRTELLENELANMTSIAVVYGGLENEGSL